MMHATSRRSLAGTPSVTCLAASRQSRTLASDRQSRYVLASSAVHHELRPSCSTFCNAPLALPPFLPQSSSAPIWQTPSRESVYQAFEKAASNFLSTSAVVLSSSCAICACFCIDSRRNSLQRSPSMTPLTGAYAPRYARWSRPAKCRVNNLLAEWIHRAITCGDTESLTNQGRRFCPEVHLERGEEVDVLAAQERHHHAHRSHQARIEQHIPPTSDHGRL